MGVAGGSKMYVLRGNTDSPNIYCMMMDEYRCNIYMWIYGGGLIEYCDYRDYLFVVVGYINGALKCFLEDIQYLV